MEEMSKQKDELEETLELGIQFFTKITQILDLYSIYFDIVNQTDKATQDLLHKLELGKIEEGEGRTQIINKLTNTRRDRRYYKDKVECLQPIYELFKNNQKLYNQLKNKLGEQKKKYMARDNRKYKPKIFTDMKVN